MKRNILLFAALFGLLNFASLRAQVKFEVDASQQGKAISQELIGAFFEDINYGADGGLYAELVQNRSFEYYPVSGYTSVSPLNSWYIIKNGGAAASMQVDNSTPLNSENTHYLKLTITDSGIGAGIRNTGFNGIAVKAGEKYNFSVYMKRETDLNQPVVVSLETPSGEEIGSDSILGISGTWQKYTLVLTAGQTENVASLNLVTKGTGNVYFDMVSLFPRNTFKNRKNGLRKDLATTIADLHPKFLRFPGGCVAHGASINNAYRWKETVGDVAERKPNWNLWGYHQTYGLGFYEYFQFCEDIGAKPLPVLWVGISCQFRNRQIVPMNEMDPVIQDAVDLIEFANGPADSQWGSVRASMGHPEPFNMEYLCLGNEEDDIPEFRERFTAIASAVKEQYPDIKIIGTSGTAASGGYYNSLWQFSREQNLYAVDEHYYMDPSWFLNNLHRYDNFDRNGPKVFIGEYASKDDRQHNAIAEASYLTGVEKNADVIQFTCYAPLLCNENNNQWNPDLIRFDNTHIVKTADYYVQQMYSVNAGDEYLASSITYNDGFTAASTDYSGKIGVGTWNTQAEFDDVKLVSGDQVLVDENYDSGASNWQVSSGTFITTGGVYSQTSGMMPAVSVFNTNIDSAEYTFSLKAMKTGGAEGFLIPFGYQDSQNFYWLNLGGWGNSLYAVEKCTNGSKTTLVSKAGSLQNNVWYNIRIEVTSTTTSFYLNDELLFEIPAPAGPVSASVTKDNETNDLIIKMVNSGDQDINTSMNITGTNLDQTAKVITLSGSSTQRNTLINPDLISPVQSYVHVTNSFDYSLPANSFQVIRVNLDNTSVGINEAKKKTKNNGLKILPNPVSGETRIVFNNSVQHDFTLAVFNASGKEVFRKEAIRDNEVSINSNRFSPGTYIVKLTSSQLSYSDKMLVGK